MGGITAGRPLDEFDRFEVDLARAVGARLRASPATVGPEVWSALANVCWKHEDGDTASVSFRRAGDIIAAILGSGDYMDWYCSGNWGHVSEAVADEMKAIGWTRDYDDNC
jgi:hypothetical protein